MASRFSLPHIDIGPFAQSQTYSGSSSYSSSSIRIRAEHGRRIQNELNAALALADTLRPTDERLEPPTGSFVQVELRRGTKPDILDQKSTNMRSGATRADALNNRTVALYVPDHARPVLEQIVEDYLNGPLTPIARNPHTKPRSRQSKPSEPRG